VARIEQSIQRASLVATIDLWLQFQWISNRLGAALLPYQTSDYPRACYVRLGSYYSCHRIQRHLQRTQRRLRPSSSAGRVHSRVCRWYSKRSGMVCSWETRTTGGSCWRGDFESTRRPGVEAQDLITALSVVYRTDQRRSRVSFKGQSSCVTISTGYPSTMQSLPRVMLRRGSPCSKQLLETSKSQGPMSRHMVASAALVY